MRHVLITIVLTACAGPAGPQGEPGPEGPVGPQGEPGPGLDLELHGWRYEAADGEPVTTGPLPIVEGALGVVWRIDPETGRVRDHADLDEVDWIYADADCSGARYTDVVLSPRHAYGRDGGWAFRPDALLVERVCGRARGHVGWCEAETIPCGPVLAIDALAEAPPPPAVRFAAPLRLVPFVVEGG